MLDNFRQKKTRKAIAPELYMQVWKFKITIRSINCGGLIRERH